VEDTIGEKSIDATQCVNGATEVVSVVHKWVCQATSDRTSISEYEMRNWR
jgi:hypothetical protein